MVDADVALLRNPRAHRRAIGAAAGVHTLVVVGLLVNAYLVPWETASCDGALDFCVSTRDEMWFLLVLSVPVLVISFVVALAMVPQLARRFSSPWTIGAVSGLVGLVVAVVVILFLIGSRVF
ncbi:hypothetical protein [Actinoplanes couchii]|uniref:Integral membrane protein n=1 Tax=Actinoplanes couchii TaxID=403638 RepID=A0ABQ3XPI8_9ACTN|nr:hypothetical protein [Actinoplanes couchii]MDR6319078.1 hypothetical protein [Actinoplanes couchii]GID60421.1 hypothetical protein Aco03nite_088250 [Actinoplanes couchii]